MLHKIVKTFSEVDRTTEFTFKVTAIVSFLASLLLYFCRITFMKAESDAGLVFDLILMAAIILSFLLSAVLGFFVLCIYISKHEVERERQGSSLMAHIKDILFVVVFSAIISVYAVLVLITAEFLSVTMIKILTVGFVMLIGGCIIAIIVINNKLGYIDAIQTKDGRYYQVEDDDVCFIESIRTGWAYRVDGYVVEYEDGKDNLFFFKEDVDLIIYENGAKRKFE